MEGSCYDKFFNRKDESVIAMLSNNSFLYDPVQDTAEINPVFEALLDYLEHNRGINLKGYKRSILMQGFEQRMQSLNINSYQSYFEYLQNQSDEHLTLLDDSLIENKNFLYDRATWDYLAAEIIPRTIAAQQPDASIRVWSVGCTKGQEIYSILILLAEALGLEACLQRVQCFATDIDQVALKQARLGTYNASEISNIPPELLQKYFEQTERGYVFHQELRQKIVFGCHDLAKAAPMSKIDLLLCRNVLLYFNSKTQYSILNRLYFALKDTGFLLLGKSERLANPWQIFAAFHTKHPVYTKEPNPESNYLPIRLKPSQPSSIGSFSAQSYAWRTAFETSSIAQLAIDLKGCLTSANEQASLTFGLTLKDWNRPFQDLEPGKLLASHTAAKTINYNHCPTVLKHIEWDSPGGTRYFDVTIAPILNAQKQSIGNTLTFLGRTESKQLSDNLQGTHAELERISQILQATQTELARAYDEIKLLTQ